jgi:hypothetical protein
MGMSAPPYRGDTESDKMNGLGPPSHVSPGCEPAHESTGLPTSSMTSTLRAIWLRNTSKDTAVEASESTLASIRRAKPSLTSGDESNNIGQHTTRTQIAILPVGRVAHEFNRAYGRMADLNLMLHQLAHSEINNLIRIPLGVEPFQHSETPKRCGNCSHVLAYAEFSQSGYQTRSRPSSPCDFPQREELPWLDGSWQLFTELLR